jgi:hypothetical protein
MTRTYRWMAVLLLVAAVGLAACGGKPATTASEAPAKVEPISGSPLKRLTLTQKATERLALQLVPVREAQVKGTQRKVVPYAAVLYDTKGDAWAYTNPEPLKFVRQPLKVDFIEGDQAILTDGPAPGTPLVTIGAAHLLGLEIGVGK